MGDGIVSAGRDGDGWWDETRWAIGDLDTP